LTAAPPVTGRPADTGRPARSDEVVAGLLAGVAAVTLLVTCWVAIRSTDALVRLLRDPLALSETQALLAGLVSAHLVLVQVVLLARLPWLERAWGRSRLVRWHRSLALWSWWLLVVHVALFVVQRTTRSPDAVLAAWWALFVTEQHMLWASLATLLLVLVLVSSLAAVRRRLRHETWHLLHLWSYASVGLALPHMLTSVDLGTGWAEAYWWTLYLVVLAVVVGWRVVLPVVRSLRLGLRVAEVRPEPGGAVSVVMAGRVDRLGARPGQFLVWRFLGGRGWTRGHPYSLSAAPDPRSVRVTVAGDGDGARRLRGLPVGSRVLVEGPYGVALPGRRRHPRLLLLAAGVGVTPFRTLLETLPLQPGEATLVVRVRQEPDWVLGAELRELCARRGVGLVVLAGPRRAPGSWLPTGVDGGPAEVLLRLVPDLASCDVLLCGPPGWMQEVRAVATRAGATHVTQEDFAW
jgi:predicted ferric reductase